ncbi:MAG: hypothetical protein R3E01_09080 [Pirellulaceae bacterium]|nr:hypothetical protein [Planctomycetales bacterium]
MIHSRLRVYYGPEDDTVGNPATRSGVPNRRTVTVPASELFSALSDAIESRRAWLADFADDEVTISTDLYEVILAYQHFRRPSA